MKLTSLVALCLTMASTLTIARAQGTAFTYQGRLNDTNGPANGTYDQTYTLYDNGTNGNIVAGPVTNTAVAVTNGLFTTTIDFGGGFSGNPRWLQIAVRTNGGPSFSGLTPRQPLTPTPYAITAGNLTGMVASNSLAGTYGSGVALTNTANVFDGTFNGDGTSLINVNAALLDGLGSANFWQTAGNYNTSPQNGNFIGTLDDNAFEIWVNDARGFRVEPPTSSIGGTVVPLASSGILPAGGESGGGLTPNIIGGGGANYVYSGVQGAVIAGGGGTDYSTFNAIGANFGVIGGGQDNLIQGGANNAFIGGGGGNSVQSGGYEFIGGGSGNSIQSDYTGVNFIQASVIAGGNNNAISTDDAFIGGGVQNQILANAGSSVIGGGDNNEIQSGATNSYIGGGFGNNITGANAVIPGGGLNSATNNAFAAGTQAQAVNQGAFVWADSQPVNFSSTANDQASFRCQGGVIFASGGSGANQTVTWTPGSGSWSFTSDRNAKENFQPLDVQSVLEKVAQLPLTEWNYKGYGDRHVGPMAQDFHAAFPFNANDKMLNSADEAGITLAAIQGLNQKLEATEKTVQEKDDKINELEKRLNDLEQVVQCITAKK